MSTTLVGRIPLRTYEMPLEIGTPENTERRKRSSDRTPKFGRKDAMKLAVMIGEAPDLQSAWDVIGMVARHLPQQAGSNMNWRGHLRRLGQSLKHEEWGRVFNLDGNTKLPHVTFSTLPVVTCPGAGDCVSHCYSLKSWQYPAAYCQQIQNTLLLKFRPEVIADKWEDLPFGYTVRLYVDGDFDSSPTFDFWMGMCDARPDLKVYGYSKSWDIIYDWFKRLDGPAPENYVLNISSGGKPQSTTKEQMLSLPFCRGEFVDVDITSQYRMSPGGYNHTRYDDPAYHDAVLRKAPPGAVSCPGDCRDCDACGDMKLRGVIIANGRH